MRGRLKLHFSLGKEAQGIGFPGVLKKITQGASGWKGDSLILGWGMAGRKKERESRDELRRARDLDRDVRVS